MLGILECTTLVFCFSCTILIIYTIYLSIPEGGNVILISEKAFEDVEDSAAYWLKKHSGNFGDEGKGGVLFVIVYINDIQV